MAVPGTDKQEALRVKVVYLLLLRGSIWPVSPSRAAVRLARPRRHFNDYVAIYQPGEEESASF